MKEGTKTLLIALAAAACLLIWVLLKKSPALGTGLTTEQIAPSTGPSTEARTGKGHF